MWRIAGWNLNMFVFSIFYYRNPWFWKTSRKQTLRLRCLIPNTLQFATSQHKHWMNIQTWKFKSLPRKTLSKKQTPRRITPTIIYTFGTQAHGSVTLMDKENNILSLWNPIPSITFLSADTASTALFIGRCKLWTISGHRVLAVMCLEFSGSENYDAKPTMRCSLKLKTTWFKSVKFELHSHCMFTTD